MSDAAQGFMTVDAVARHLSVSRRTVYEWVSQRRIPFYKIGGTLLRFQPDEIERWTRESFQAAREFASLGEK
ncbi:MAG TPA: helix-turn-helix domain-containing protein [Elusimicrobiota bacterium]|nr:helix-turn-helix domain-containing protein [Elusimicrobiota bacterium]